MFLPGRLCCCCVVLLLCVVSPTRCDDYYEMFGIARDATDRDIRKAFKKLAVVLHPDKNPDDPEADTKFIKITRAYEVLKDADSRKRYDLYGDEGAGGGSTGRHYESWSYYHDQFGIYDDDPEIVTLSHADFDNSVLRSPSLWYVNFYSTQCSHCHRLAPTWRRLARLLRGAVRVGAVNCEEDWALCRQEGVRSYPSVVVYPAREKYQGDRSEDELTKFILERLSVTVATVTVAGWDRSKSWVLFLCEGACYEDDTRLLVAAMLANLVTVGQVDCAVEAALCAELLPGGGADGGGAVVYYSPVAAQRVREVEGGEAPEVAGRVLALLPEAVELNDESFQDMREWLDMGATAAWLVHFDIGAGWGEELEWRRLPALVPPSVNLARVHCGRHNHICAKLHVRKYPTFIVFKPRGGHEVFHGRANVHDVADFARDSAEAPNVRSLAPDEFEEVTQEGGGAWLVDFYAPWCPPCLRLLPELRAVSRDMRDAVRVGTVDCTLHDALCRRQQVTAYPTTVLYNGTARGSQYRGVNKAEHLREFVQDLMNPIVTKLTETLFYSLVGNKPVGEMWAVDFFAPWCGPCQQLAPEWRKLAKMVSSLPHVHLGEVDCVNQAELCQLEGVRSYPTIRLYPLGGRGLNTVAIFSGYQRDAHSLRKWLFDFLPSPVEELTPASFEGRVVGGGEAWLVDFYAPWCGHCVVFEPEFTTLAQRLEGRVRCGKLNCELYRSVCQAAGVRGYPSVLFYGGGAGDAARPRRGVEIPSQTGEEILRVVEAALEEGKGKGEGVASITRDEL